ncbi:MAG: DUF3800 domain-containing protein [Acidimicrobiia bacterium]
MYLCYVDEAGDAQPIPLASASPTVVAPVFVLGGLIIDASEVGALSAAYLDLKTRFYPGLMSSLSHHLDSVLVEVKASDIRRAVRSGSRDERRTAIGFVDRVFDLLETHDARLIARVWVKTPGASFNGRSTYTYSMQALCRAFQQYLISNDGEGMVVADSRTHQLDERVAHSLYTMKHRVLGDELNRVVEVPTFGRSGNHVGLQIADLVNGVLFPMATRTYCAGVITGVHVAPQYDTLRMRYGSRFQDLQYRYSDISGRWRGGITVSDPVGRQPGSALFSPP